MKESDFRKLTGDLNENCWTPRLDFSHVNPEVSQSCKTGVSQPGLSSAKNLMAKNITTLAFGNYMKRKVLFQLVLIHCVILFLHHGHVISHIPVVNLAIIFMTQFLALQKKNTIKFKINKILKKKYTAFLPRCRITTTYLFQYTHVHKLSNRVR